MVKRILRRALTKVKAIRVHTDGTKQPSIDYLDRRLKEFEMRADNLIIRAEVYRRGRI